MRSLVVIALLLVAQLAGASCDSKSAHRSGPSSSGPNPSVLLRVAAKLDQERKLISLSKTEQSMTAMVFTRTTPPPWEHGNTLEFQEVPAPATPGGLEERAIWRGVNIHAENLGEITRRLGLDLLEVQIVHQRQPSEIQETGRPARKIIADPGFALITDPCIPKEWLRAEPGSDWDIGRQLSVEYPEAFRRN